MNFQWISQTPSVNFPWNLAYFKNSTVKSRIFSRELGWSLHMTNYYCCCILPEGLLYCAEHNLFVVAKFLVIFVLYVKKLLHHTAFFKFQLKVMCTFTCIIFLSHVCLTFNVFCWLTVHFCRFKPNWQKPNSGASHIAKNNNTFFIVLILTVKVLCCVQEMQQSMNMLQPQQNLPDAAEMLTKWFGGGGSSGDAAKKSSAKSRSVRNRWHFCCIWCVPSWTVCID